jgi:phytoene dehydrogenase-like protein
MHRLEEELGVMMDRTFIDFEEFARFESKDGQILKLYTDIDRLEQHLREIAPEDGEVISEFIEVLRAFIQFKMPIDVPPELAGPPEPFDMPLVMMKWMGMTMQVMAEQFKNPLIREGLPNIFFGSESSILPLLSGIALMHQKAAGYPIGGFLELVRAMEQRYLNLGGEILYRSPVVKVLVENDQAVGVQLADGTEYRADVIISAADGHTTIFNMLEGKYINDEIRGYYNTLPVYPPIFFISLGVDRSFEGIPPIAAGEVFALEKPVTIAGKQYEWLTMEIYNFDPSVVPEGKTLLKVIMNADYQYWKNLKTQDRERYKTEKEQVVNQVIELLDRRYPGIGNQVEMRDIATPVTFERYTGNWQGSWMGWMSTPQTLMMQVSKTLPGLNNFYMIGTWALNGSLPSAANSGRHIAQIICNEDKKQFATTVP